MAYQLGEVVKKIRQSKRYTQKYVSGNQMSRTTFSKIEAGEMQPTVGKFMHILERLDITYEEFKYIENMYTLNGKDEIMFDFFQISTNVEVKDMEMLIDKCSDFLDNYSDSIVDDIRSVCKALVLVHLQNSFEEAYPFAEKVWKRLSQLDNWYSTELKLINNIFFFFPLETGISIVERALREIDRFSYFNQNKELKAAYLINMTLLLINNEQFAEANNCAEKAIQECIVTKRYEVISLAFARKGIALINLGKEEQGISAIRKAIQISSALGQTGLIESFKGEIREKTKISI
ncbi:helix-turn-helix domain-containing protein [Sporolactobacillus pectinivorans]|uniref:helix-turn-helix domain-containing protein n=1 Tax=Sporolactobacillus pectinivorans TaxID=1591408 RepID=UPI000C25E990|nr:Rgg/GadR/MutR family transcriptional regulator [Sporolactobacillus pectinivorans]